MNLPIALSITHIAFLLHLLQVLRNVTGGLELAVNHLIDFVITALRTYPEIALFLTLAIGFLFGPLKLGPFSLGTVTSTLIAGLIVGQLHVTVAPLM